MWPPRDPKRGRGINEAILTSKRSLGIHIAKKINFFTQFVEEQKKSRVDATTALYEPSRSI